MEGSGVESVNSQFAMPPMQFIELYSTEAVRLGVAPSAPPCVQGVYHMFGQQCSTTEPILNPLSVQDIQQVYSSSTDPRVELKRLNRSLVAAFLDLVELLIRCPESNERQTKMDDLRLLLINMHHLLNEYRPQQARQCIQLTMNVQHSDRQQTLLMINTLLQQVTDQLRACATHLGQGDHMEGDLMHRVQGMLQTKHTPGGVVSEGGCAGDNKQGHVDVDTDKHMCAIMDMM